MFAAYVKRLQRILAGFQVEWRKSVDVHRDSGTALSLLFTFSFTCRCRMRKYYCDNWSVWRPFCHLLKGILLILLLLSETFNETAEKKVFLHYCTLCHFFLQVFFSVVEVEINGPFLEYCRKLTFFFATAPPPTSDIQFCAVSYVRLFCVLVLTPLFESTFTPSKMSFQRTVWLCVGRRHIFKMV